MKLTDVTLKTGVQPSFEAIESFRLMDQDGTEYTFKPGDRVWYEHLTSGSRTPGTVTKFFGVGRLRGVQIKTDAFGERSFYFGQYEDDLNGYRLTPYTGSNTAPRHIVKFTVEFDSEVWNSMTPEQQQAWINTVTDGINDEAHVSYISY